MKGKMVSQEILNAGIPISKNKKANSSELAF
jgi:hypothetical protein